jgi:hypothetical protein
MKPLKCLKISHLKTLSVINTETDTGSTKLI